MTVKLVSKKLLAEHEVSCTWQRQIPFQGKKLCWDWTRFSILISPLENNPELYSYKNTLRDKHLLPCLGSFRRTLGINHTNKQNTHKKPSLHDTDWSRECTETLIHEQYLWTCYCKCHFPTPPHSYQPAKAAIKEVGVLCKPSLSVTDPHPAIY